MKLLNFLLVFVGVVLMLLDDLPGMNLVLLLLHCCHAVGDDEDDVDAGVGAFFPHAEVLPNESPPVVPSS